MEAQPRWSGRDKRVLVVARCHPGGCALHRPLPALEAPRGPEADKTIRIGPRPASMRGSGGAFGRGLPAHRVAHGSVRMQWVRPAPAGNIRVAVSARLNRADVRKWGLSRGTGDPGCRR